MKVSAWNSINKINSQLLIRRVFTIEQHHRRPIFSWVSSLYFAVHLDPFNLLVIMLDAHDRFFAPSKIEQFGNIGPKQSIRITEQGPALLGKNWHEKS